MNGPSAYYLTPETTKLDPGSDDSLAPDPTGPVAPHPVWPFIDTSRGTAGTDETLRPAPQSDPLVRSAPPAGYPTYPNGRIISNRPLHETTSPEPGLDPDIALWQTIIVNIWPFPGAPTVGIFPRGWFGIDSTGQPWVCTAGGAPGTWAPIGFTSAGVSSFDTRTGAVVFNLADAESIFTGADELLVGTGAGTGALLALGSARVYMSTGGTNFLSNGVNTTVTFDSVDYQAGSVSTAAANSLTIGATGKHQIDAQVYIVEQSAITRYVGTVLVNGSIRIQSEAAANGNFACLQFHSPLSLSAGDVVTVKAQVNGATTSVETAPADTFLAATLLPT
jgi:hypothetical protein